MGKISREDIVMKALRVTTYWV